MRHPIQLMVLAWLLAVPGGASAQSGGSFDLSWSSIGGGGSRSTGTGFTLQGLVASWNSGQSTGGTFTLQGGWGGPIATTDAPVAPIPAAFAWQPARPNPFFDRSSIEFGLPHSSHVQLAVFDISGRRLRLLVDEFLAPGWHHTTWDGTGERGERLPGGIYFVRLDAGDIHASSRIAFVH